MSPVEVQPTGFFFRPDSKRVIVRPSIPADATLVGHIIARALS